MGRPGLRQANRLLLVCIMHSRIRWKWCILGYHPTRVRTWIKQTLIKLFIIIFISPCFELVLQASWSSCASANRIFCTLMAHGLQSRQLQCFLFYYWKALSVAETAAAVSSASSLPPSKAAAFFDASDSDTDSDASSGILQPTQVGDDSIYNIYILIIYY